MAAFVTAIAPVKVIQTASARKSKRVDGGTGRCSVAASAGSIKLVDDQTIAFSTRARSHLRPRGSAQVARAQPDDQRSLPFLLYGILQPNFPANSVLPLLCATTFPVIGLMLSLLRKRAVDVIAIITMVGPAFHIAVTLLMRSVSIALVVRSLDGALIGLALVISTLIGRPIVLLVAKQIVAAAVPNGRRHLIG